MCQRSLFVLLVVVLGLGDVVRGDHPPPCPNCEICSYDLPDPATARWTHVYWYDPVLDVLRLTVFVNWVPTWYTITLGDPNCAAIPHCQPSPGEPNDPYDFVSDCDDDGRPDWCQLLGDPNRASLDCDGDLRLDACQLRDGTGSDCNANGRLDRCEPDEDCNGNGQRDLCEVFACPPDDPACADCDGNGRPDPCDLLTELDCDGDGQLDRCQIASDPNADCNLDGVLDACDPNECPPPALQRIIGPDPNTACDLIVWASHCAAIGFSLGQNDGGCTLIEQGSGGNGWYYARLRGCLPAQRVTLLASAGGCLARFVIETNWNDCNRDHVPDRCQIAGGELPDCNANQVPDACETLDCDFLGDVHAIGPDADGGYELRVPHCGPVAWEIISNEPACPNLRPLPSGPGLQRARLGTCPGSGWLTVRARSAADPNCHREVRIPLGCAVGNPGELELGSLRTRIPLGPHPGGGSCGQIVFYNARPDLDPISPAELQVPVRHPDVEVERGPGGDLRTVRTPWHRFDVEVLGAEDFQLNLRLADVTDQQVSQTPPLRSWRMQRLPGAEPGWQFERTHPLRRQQARYDPLADSWTLRWLDAEGETVRRQRTAWHGNLRTTRIWQDGGLLRLRSERFDPDRLRVLETVDDPNGAARITRRRYDGQGRLAEQIEPSGSWQTWTRDAFGRPFEQRRGWLNSSDPNGLCLQTTSFYDLASDPNALDARPIRVEQRLGGVLRETWTRRSWLRTEPNEPVRQVTEIMGCPADGGPCRTAYLLRDPNDRLRGYTAPDGTFLQIDALRADVLLDADDSPLICPSPAGAGYLQRSTHLSYEGAAPRSGWTIRSERWSPGTLPGLQLERQSAYLPEAGTDDGFVVLRWRIRWLDALGRVIAIRDHSGPTTSIEYEPDGTRIVHRPQQGLSWTLTPDALGRIVSSERSAHPDLPGLRQTSVYRVESAGLERVVTTTDLASGQVRQRRTQWDRLGRLRTSWDPSGQATTRHYSQPTGEGPRVLVTHPDGLQETHRFYRDGTPHSLQGAGLVDRTWHYQVAGNGSLREREQLPGSWLLRTRDPFGTLREIVQPTWGASSDPNACDPNMLLTRTFERDTLGRIEAEHVSSGGQRRLSSLLHHYEVDAHRVGYDHNANQQLDDPNEPVHETTLGYVWHDGRPWLVQRTSGQATEIRQAIALGDGPGESLASGPDGRLLHQTWRWQAGREERVGTLFERGVPVAMQHSSHLEGRVLDQSSTNGSTWHWKHNAFGERVEARGPLGRFSADYDEAGRVRTARRPGGGETHYSYDVRGRLQSVTDPLGRKRYYAWNAFGRLARVWGAGVYPVAFGYDERGLLQSCTTFRAQEDWFGPDWPDASGDTRTWERDPATGLVNRIVTPLGRETTFRYDVLGRVLEEGPGSARTYQYEPRFGRVASVQATNAAATRFAWGSDGRLQALVDAAGRRTVRYDRWQRPVGWNWDGDSLFPDRQVHLSVEVGAPRLTESGDTGRVWGRQTQHVRVQPDGYRARHSSAAGRRSLRLGGQQIHEASSGRQVTLQWQDWRLTTEHARGHGRPQRMTLHHRQTERSSLAYQFDPLDRLVAETTEGDLGDRLTEWEHDQRDALVATRRYMLDPGYDPGRPDPLGDTHSAFDSGGNRVRHPDPNDLHAFNADNQPIVEIHDARGRRVEDADWHYEWDGHDRLRLVTPRVPGQGDRRYRYRHDALGRRIERVTEALGSDGWQQVGCRRWLWLGDQVLVEYELLDGTLRVVSCRARLGSELRIDEAGSSVRIRDALGRTRLQLQGNGQVLGFARDAWGAGAPPDEREPWGGQRYGQRDYDPARGRWLQPDPLDVRGGSNLYRYVDNAVTERIDPSGLCGVDLRALAQESPAFAARANLPSLVRLEQMPIRLPEIGYGTFEAAGRGLDTQTPRLLGTVGAVGSGAEVALGVLALKCSGGLAAPVGVLLIGHGLDGLQSNLRTVWHNEAVDSVTFGIGQGLGERFGGPTTGLVSGTVLDLGLGIGGPLLGGRLLRLNRLGLLGQGDCCCCQLQFVRAPIGDGTEGILLRGGFENPQLNLMLDQTNTLQVRLGQQILELDFEVVLQHDGTLHLMDLDVLDSVGGPNTLGNSVLLQLFGQLQNEARALGFRQLRISGYRATGASPGRRIDRCWNLSE